MRRSNRNRFCTEQLFLLFSWLFCVVWIKREKSSCQITKWKDSKVKYRRQLIFLANCMFFKYQSWQYDNSNLRIFPRILASLLRRASPVPTLQQLPQLPSTSGLNRHSDARPLPPLLPPHQERKKIFDFIAISLASALLFLHRLRGETSSTFEEYTSFVSSSSFFGAEKRRLRAQYAGGRFWGRPCAHRHPSLW